MTKGELIKLLEGSTLSIQPVTEKYCETIKNLLYALKDETEISELNLPTLNSFKDYVKAQDFTDAESKLYDLVLDIKTGLCNQEISKVQNSDKKQKDRFKLFIAIISVFAIVVVVFTILDIFKMISFGSEVASVIGLLDLLFGLAFFAYERHNDMVKNSCLEVKENVAKILKESGENQNRKVRQKSNGNNSPNINNSNIGKGANIGGTTNNNNFVSFKYDIGDN